MPTDPEIVDRLTNALQAALILAQQLAADVTQDQRTGLSFYTVRIAVPPEELARMEGPKLIPGMPVEVYIQTTIRTVASYLVRPFQDQIAKAFREK
jgi:HlyD family secretion protein